MKRHATLLIVLAALAFSTPAYAPYETPGRVEFGAVTGVKLDTAVAGMPVGTTLGGTVTDAAKLGLTGVKAGAKVTVTSKGDGKFTIRTTGENPVSIHVHMDDYWAPAPGLAALGLATVKSLPKGKAVGTTVTDPARLASHGLKGLAKGAKVAVTRGEGGKWTVAGQGSGGPVSTHIQMEDYFRPRAPLAAALGRAGLTADLTSLPVGADLLVTVGKPAVLAKHGLAGLAAGDMVLLAGEKAGWRATSLVPGFPLSLHVHRDDFYGLGVTDPRLATLPKGARAKAKVADPKKAAAAGMKGVKSGTAVDLAHGEKGYRAKGLVAGQPVTIHIKMDEYWREVKRD